jgi:hypothetical protein
VVYLYLSRLKSEGKVCDKNKAAARDILIKRLNKKKRLGYKTKSVNSADTVIFASLDIINEADFKNIVVVRGVGVGILTNSETNTKFVPMLANRRVEITWSLDMRTCLGISDILVVCR